VQGAGVCVTNVTIEDDNSILGETKNYAVQLTPIQGKVSTVHFKLPVVSKDGTYTANGNKYRLIKQIGDVPIRKIAPDKVALTTYYAKLFVCRGSKVSTDYGIWAANAVMANAIDAENKIVTDYTTGSYPVEDSVMPRIYTSLMGRFKSLTVRGFSVYFDPSEIEANLPKALVQTYAADAKYVIGQNKAGHLLLIDDNASAYIIDKSSVKEAGTFEEFLGIDIALAPVEFLDVAIFGKDVSVGFILAYYYGFEALLKALKAKYRTVLSGQRINMLPDEYTVVFKDQTYVFQRDEKINALIIAGFRQYHKAIKLYDSHSFNSKAVYSAVLAVYGLNVRYLRELDLMEDMFVDPISKEVLVRMKEPTDFKSLLIRSAELLTTDKAPRELMLAGQMRIKGYERFAGVVYQELVRSIRAHNAAPAKSTRAIALNPHDVWNAISEDGAKQLISDINPIEDLRGSEALTLAGSGGRSKRSMVKRTRSYDQSHVGVISEATKDSSDVGINTYLSANPGIKDLYGFTTDTPDLTAPATILSTSALMAPGSDVDDTKRVGVVSIQNAHTMPCVGYVAPTVRTGYETIIADRTSENFAVNAKQPGKVIELSDHAIVVEYQDKTQVGYKLGTYYGPAAGLTIPHEITTFMKLNQKFSVGDTICYNDGFFTKDWANPTRVIMKGYALSLVAQPEFEGTIEDSSVISDKLALDLNTKITKIKSIVVRFDQTVSNMLSIGTHVTYDTILCYVQDATTAENKMFDESTIEQLKVLGAHAPKAKVEGMIEKIEVFYHGDIEDMSETLAKLAQQSDSRLKIQARRLKKVEYTGSVDAGYRIKSQGDSLPLDTAEIKVYISHNVDTGVGDKIVFVNQLKSTIAGRYKDGDYKTESGENIDAIFGAKSSENRIVQSVYKVGTANTLLKLLTQAAIKAYES